MKNVFRSAHIPGVVCIIVLLIGGHWALAQAPQTSGMKDTRCPGDTVTVTMDDWSSRPEAKAARTEVITAFEQAYPCIKVRIVQQANEDADVTRLQQILDGTASDLIATIAEYISIYTEAGGLADLSPFIEADPEFRPEEMFFQGIWESGFYKGIPRAINKDFSTSAIYVNARLFEQAGLELPEEGWTYDDYLKLALQLTLDKNGNNAASPNFDPGNIVQYGTTIPYWKGTTKAWFRGFENVLYSFGAHAISPDATTTIGYLNSEQAVQAWEFYRHLVHTYHVSPSVEVVNAIEDGNVGLFRQGKLAMSGNFWGPWYDEVFDATPNLKWTVVPLPSGPAGHKGVVMWMGWGINQQTAHPKESWELLKWLTGEPGQRVYIRRALTQVKSVAIEFQRINDPFWGVFLLETDYIDRLDDALHPRFFPCVAEGPTAEFLLKTWSDGGNKLDIQTTLNELAVQADQCLIAGQ